MKFWPGKPVSQGIVSSSYILWSPCKLKLNASRKYEKAIYPNLSMYNNLNNYYHK